MLQFKNFARGKLQIWVSLFAREKLQIWVSLFAREKLQIWVSLLSNNEQALQPYIDFALLLSFTGRSFTDALISNINVKVIYVTE